MEQSIDEKIKSDKKFLEFTSKIKQPKFYFLWASLCQEKKCYMCSAKFPDGIVNKNPKDLTTPFINRFKVEFLFHLKTTHGLEPLDFLNHCIEVCK